MAAKNFFSSISSLMASTAVDNRSLGDKLTSEFISTETSTSLTDGILPVDFDDDWECELGKLRPLGATSGDLTDLFAIHSSIVVVTFKISAFLISLFVGMQHVIITAARK